MREELEIALQERFSFLKRPDLESMRTREYEPIAGFSTYDNWGTEIPDGWFDLVVALFSEIEELYKKEGVAPDYKLEQIKEKFGTLRVYGHRKGRTQGIPAIDNVATGESLRLHSKEVDPLTASINDIIRKYEELSKVTCEGCGVQSEDVKLRNEPPVFRWVTTLCDSCMKERVERYSKNIWS